MELKKITKDIVHHYEVEMRKVHYDALKNRHLEMADRISSGEVHPHTYKHMFQQMEDPTIRGAKSAFDVNYSKILVSQWLQDEGYDLSTLDADIHNELALLRNELLMKRTSLNNLLLDNKISEFKAGLGFFKEKPVKEREVISFLELFEQFFKFKTTKSAEREKPLSDDMQEEYRRYVDYIKFFRPDFADMPIDEVDRDVVKTVILDYRSVPVRNKKPYNRLSWAELVEYMEEYEIPDDDLPAGGSVDNVRKFIQGVFSYAVEKKLLSASPALKLRLDINLKGNRGHYRLPEVTRLEQGFLQLTNVHRKWVGLLGFYTGARASEITQLRKIDVRLDEVSQRHYLVITESAGSTKTSSGNRNVPIHKKLLEFGFMDYVGSCDDLLFPEFSTNHITQWLYPLQDKVGVSSYDEHGKKRDFHSVRHTVITMLLNSGHPIPLVQQMLGHKVINMGITERYRHDAEIHQLVDVIDSLSYELDPSLSRAVV